MRPERARLGRVEREIRQLEADRDRLAREEQGVLGRLDRLAADARLLDARLERLDLLRSGAERSLAELQDRQKDSESRLTDARRRLRLTVLLLHQPGPLGRLRLVLQGEDAQELTAGWRLAEELTLRQKQEVAAVRAALRDLARVRRDGERQAAELRQLAAETVAAQASLSTAIDQRRKLLADIREQSSERQVAIDELERASRELQDILNGASASHPVSLDVKAFRGLLPMPVPGPVTRAFGESRDPRLGAVLPHRGWDIAASYGGQVRAIFDGRVVWASWFRGYGLMVVLDHGGGVHSVYAHLSTVLVQNGAGVTQGQVLGNVGDTGSLGGPLLYLEIRRAGRAEDPAKWIRRPPRPEGR